MNSGRKGQGKRGPDKRPRKKRNDSTASRNENKIKEAAKVTRTNLLKCWKTTTQFSTPSSISDSVNDNNPNSTSDSLAVQPPVITKNSENTTTTNNNESTTTTTTNIPFTTSIINDEITPLPIEPNLDIDDENEAGEDDENYESGIEYEKGIIYHYIKKIHQRLQKETSKDNNGLQEKWLLNLLKENDFWLRSQQAEKLCKKLKIKFGEPSYYRDIKGGYPMNNGVNTQCPFVLPVSPIHMWECTDGEIIISQDA